MRLQGLLHTVTVILWLCVCTATSSAGVDPLNSPTDIRGATVINFDGHPGNTAANVLYQPQGITFTRDDGQALFISNWKAEGRTTTSPPNVLATVTGEGAYNYATHLNVLSSSPIFAMGGYFGNDQADPDFTLVRMSAYGLTGNYLGAVQVAANGNTSVDQFIGFRSDVPIGRVRFDNLTAAGTHSASYSVVIDDLVFAHALQLSVDIKPGSCPNPLNMKGDQGKGGSVLPAAILGTDDLDVRDIDPSTLSLLRVSPLRWSYEDVATPVGDAEDDCNCTTEGPDGHEDLTLKFLRSEIIEALRQIPDDPTVAGQSAQTFKAIGDGLDEVTVTISGQLNSRTPIEGHDCLLLLHKGELIPVATPKHVSLGANQPNPFNPATNISFTLPEPGKVKLEVFNILGRRMIELVNGWLDAGKHTVTWDAGASPSGLYLYRMEAGEFVETRRMMLLK